MAPNTTNTSPICWGTTVGTTSQPVLPANVTRSGLIFINAGTIAIAICPALVNLGVLGVYAAPATGVAVINGAGSVTLQPGDKFIFDTVNVTTAWNGVAASNGA